MPIDVDGPKVLMLLDDVLLAAMLEDGLAALGHYVVHTCATAADAESFLNGEEAVDAVLIDFKSRNVPDPVETGRQIAASSPAVVIYLTANPSDVEAVIRHDNESGWVEWPFAIRDLDFEIRLAMEHAHACAKRSTVEAEPF